MISDVGSKYPSFAASSWSPRQGHEDEVFWYRGEPLVLRNLARDLHSELFRLLRDFPSLQLPLVPWDPYSHQLILLLANGIAADQEALDLLDPDTGTVRRLLLRFPEGTTHKQLSQVAVGHRYLWFRSHSGASPTFRLDRSALEQARSVTGLQHSAIAGE